MSRLADPALCPDCRSLVRPDAVCSSCGLTLTGPLATELWTTMLTADSLIERLRLTAPSPVADAPASSASAAPTVPAMTPGLPPFPTATATTPVATGVGSRAVPVLLLSLGGLLVVTAVSIFLAVTWTILPLAAKAVIMVVVTGGLGALAVGLTRKALRGSAEALWAITAALLALDLSAAYRSGLFGLDALSARTMTGAGGLLVAAIAVGAALWVATTQIKQGVALEIAASLALLVICLAWFWNGPAADGAGPALGVVALAAVAHALRTRVRITAVAAQCLAVASWLVLVRVGSSSGFEDGARFSTFWASLDWWPLVVAAALATVVAVIPQLAPPQARSVSAGAALAVLGLLAVLPVAWTTREVVVSSAVVLVLAAAARFGPGRWDRAAAWLGAVGAGAGLLGLVVTPLVLVLQYVDESLLWVNPLDDRFPTADGPLSWTAIAVVAAVLVLPLGARGHLPTERAAVLTSSVIAGGPALFGLALTTGLGGAALPLWAVVLGFVATVVAGAVSAVRASGVPRIVAAAIATEAAVLGILAASRSDLASALLASVLLAVCVAVFVRLRSGDGLGAPAVAGAAVVSAAYAVGTWSLVADLNRTPQLIAVSLVAALGLVVAGWVGRTSAQRVAVEVAASLVGIAAAAAALDDVEVLAVVLTVVGTALAVSSVVRLDRHLLGWAASLVLFVATLVRLTTDHRIAPELYAAPAAALLIVVGVIRLVRSPALGSWRTLGSGLNLALVPSTLIALAEPDSWRTLVVIVGGAAAVGLGLVRHWQAPFLVGGAVLAAIALRFLLPLAATILANPLGAWMLFGGAGAAFLVAGVLWEQSLRNLRGASRYVGALG